MIHEFSVNSSSTYEVIDISSQVKKIVNKSDIKEGICVIYTGHATTSIIINENYDPNIGNDFLKAVNKLIPLHDNYEHDKVDNNAAAHIKSAIIGPSKTIPIYGKKLTLGTWQDVWLVDFDGPKERKILVKIIEG